MQITITLDTEVDDTQMVRAIVRALGYQGFEQQPAPIGTPQRYIAPEDRPDVGADSQSAAMVFGQQYPNVQPILTGDDASNAANTPPDVDSTGLPWDARIHSSSHELTDKGLWRRRRGVDELTVNKVSAELRLLRDNDRSGPDQTPLVQAMINHQAASYVSPAGAAVGLPPAMQPPPVVPLPPAATPAAPHDFATLMSKATAVMAAGKMTRVELESCATAAGLESIIDVMKRPDTAAAVGAAIDQLVASKG